MIATPMSSIQKEAISTQKSNYVKVTQLRTTRAQEESSGQSGLLKPPKKMDQNDPSFLPPKLRGKLYISRKKSVGEHTGNQHTDSELGQSGPIPSTAEAVAKETGVSPRTIKRDAAYAEAAS
jgi:hypothetical protein